MILAFTTGSALVLFISGLLKVFSITNTIKMINKMGIFPSKLSNILGYLFPWIEISLAIVLFWRVDIFIINIITLLVFGIFIVINVSAIIENKQIECNCFGNFIKSKIGYGGLVQSILLILSIIPTLFFPPAFNSIFMLQSQEFFILILTGIIWCLTLIITRIAIETYS